MVVFPFRRRKVVAKLVRVLRAGHTRGVLEGS
jgi:hypothetical protein